MPKDVHYQQERAKLSELGGKSKSTVEASPSQSNRLRAAGEMRSPGEGPKRMKEVACTRVGGKVVAVEKRELKEGAVPCVGAKVDPGASYGENLKNTKRHFSKRERDFQTNASLASGEKDGAGKMFVMSKSRKQMWDRMRKSVASAPPLVQMKDYRPKGKTYRKAHYDPQEVADDRAKQILRKRQRNDSKPGGQSKSRMFGKRHPELGGNRGFRRPYRERPDRPFNFDEDEGGPPM